MSRLTLTRVAAIGLALSAVGCKSVSSAIDSASRKMGEGVGNAVGTRIGNQMGAAVSARMPAVWTPDFTQVYASYLFAVAFHAGSYDVEPVEYKAGDYTRWRIVEMSKDGNDAQIERAFLQKTSDGKEWWRVAMFVTDASQKPAKSDTILMEALFSADNSQMLRMRAKFPGDKEAKEVAVTENTYGYAKPIALTSESIQGATVGTESISVPAGSFSAKHIKYGNMGGGSLDWWSSTQVPGGLVKYSSTGPENSGSSSSNSAPSKNSYTVELIKFGRDAKSVTGAF